MRVLLALILSLVSLPALAEVKVYLLLGQSNMTGNAPVSQATAITGANKITVLRHDGFFSQGVAEPAHGGPFVYSVFNGNANLGPTRWIGERLAARFPEATQILLVPCAKAGVSINGYAKSSGQPWTSMYNACLARIERTYWQGKWPGVPRKIAGVLFNQGYADAFTEANATAWASKFTTLVANFRADLGIPDLPVAFVKQVLSPQCEAVQVGDGPFLPQVWAGMDSIEIPNVRKLEIGPLGMQSDCAHHTAQGYKDLGHALGDAMADLELGIGEPEPDPDPDPEPEPLPMCPFPCQPVNP